MATEKKTIADLALFGGRPAFADKLHVGRPNIGDRDRLRARLNDLLDRKWLTNNGPFVQELEQRLADYLGVKHCVCMCNGTVALEITIRALELTGEVLVPSLTFIATAHALQWQQITPVFCDVDPATYNLDVRGAEKMITPRTTGIIGVHLWGRPCAVEALADLAERRRLALLFDASHALGCSRDGRPVGGFGHAEVFSFHATKFFNTFEGGAVTTNDDALAAKMRLMKNFGFAGLDQVIYIGTNGKMSEASAAMGLTSLDSIDDFVAANRRNYHAYRRQFAQAPGVQLLAYDERERNNFQYIVIEIDEAQAGLNRDALLKILQAENVLARRYFYPGCHRMEPYRSFFPHAGLLLPQTERILDRVLSLPTGTSVEVRDIEAIGNIIQVSIAAAADVARRLAAG